MCWFVSLAVFGVKAYIPGLFQTGSNIQPFRHQTAQTCVKLGPIRSNSSNIFINSGHGTAEIGAVESCDLAHVFKHV